MIQIVVTNEQSATEQRVALTPDGVKKLVQLGNKVLVEKNAGSGAHFSDVRYEEAGAQVVKSKETLYKKASIVLRVSPLEPKDLKLLPAHSTIIGMLSPYNNLKMLNELGEKHLTAMALELIPRISRAQSMDVLSSQSNLAGYRAVIEAAFAYGKSFAMMMTAAGTVSPARVLVLGAGVAGLQAIATAKRLGAIVSAFDVRAAVKEQVASLGATFIEVAGDEAGEGAGGYAKEMSHDYKLRQQEKLENFVPTQNVVVTTAQIPGQTAPVLVTEKMIEAMMPGSVIVDLAAETGGNCALTEKGKLVVKNGVKIIGYINVPSRLAADASQVYSQNLLNFLKLLLPEGGGICLDDEIIRATLLTHEGKIVHPLYKTTQEG